MSLSAPVRSCPGGTRWITPMGGLLCTYEQQRTVLEFCTRAEEAFRSPGLASKVYGLSQLVLARIVSAGSGLSTLCRALCRVYMFPLRFVQLGLITCKSPCLISSLVRVSIAAVLSVTLTALRVLSLVLGSVIPEIIFGILHVHRVLLRLGLICDVQFVNMLATLPPQLRSVAEELGDVWWRFSAVNEAMDRVQEIERSGCPVDCTTFEQTVWREALLSAFGTELGTRITQAEAPAREMSPVEQRFTQGVLDGIRREVSLLVSENIYTPDEVEDLFTALPAVLNRAILLAVDKTFVLTGDGMVLASGGDRVTRENGGQLEAWSSSIFSVKRTVHQLTERARTHPEGLDARDLRWLPYYLCVDDARIQRLFPDFPARRSEPVQSVLNNVVCIRVGFVEKHMQNAEAFAQALQVHSL